MQVLAIPQLPWSVGPLVLAVMFTVMVLIVWAHQEKPTRLRMLIAAGVVALFVGAHVYASEPAMCAVSDATVVDPCRICKDLDSSDWRWWALGCFGCRLRVRRNEQ